MEDREFFQDRTDILMQTRADPAELDRARGELAAYLTRLAARKREEPDDGIISRLVARGELSEPAIVNTCMFLLIAGRETTANMITLAVLALLRNPEQLAALRAQKFR